MKKKLFGILLIAVLTVVGGFNYFSNATVARAYEYCDPNGSGSSCGFHSCVTVGVVGDNAQCNAATGNTRIQFRCGDSSAWVRCGAITGDTTGNVASSRTSTNPILTFSQVAGATGYTLQLSASPSFSPLVINTNLSTNTTRVFPAGSPNQLAPDTQYYFRVKAFNSMGLTSDWSTTFTFRTAATTNATATILCPEGAPSSPYCFSAMLAPTSGVTSDSIFTLLATTGAEWKTASGKAITPNAVHAETRFYDENGNAVFISGSASQNIVDLINGLVSGR